MPCIVPVLGLLGGGVHTCVFWLLVGAVCCVEGGGPGGGVVEGGVWEVPPCCPRVQGGRGGPFCLYGVSLLLSATVDEDVGVTMSQRRWARMRRRWAGGW